MLVMNINKTNKKMIIQHYRWRKVLIRAMRISAIAILLTELLIFVVLYWNNLIEAPDSTFVWFLKYVLLPSVINFSVYFGCRWLHARSDVSETLKTYAALIGLLILVTGICLIHNAVKVVWACYTIVLFMTVIFGDKKLLRNMLFLILFCFMLSILLTANLQVKQGITYFIMDSVATGIFLMASYFLSLNVLSYERSQIRLLKHSYSKQAFLRELTQHDQNTGLYNRTAFYFKAEQKMTKARQLNIPLSLAVLDIDDFKKINDEFGHYVGDGVISDLAELLEKSCGEQDFAARYGGEEFVVLFYNADIDEALRRMTKFQNEVANHVFKDVPYGQVTFSAGIVQMGEQTLNVADLFIATDKVLYDAKRSGKDTIKSAVDF